MGQVDDMRAMREARYAAAAAQRAGAKPSSAADRAAKAQRALAKAVSPSAPTGELCGHRSISNKTCTREKDHQASGTKHHRYGTP